MPSLQVKRHPYFGQVSEQVSIHQQLKAGSTRIRRRQIQGRWTKITTYLCSLGKCIDITWVLRAVTSSRCCHNWLPRYIQCFEAHKGTIRKYSIVSFLPTLQRALSACLIYNLSFVLGCDLNPHDFTRYCFVTKV